MRRRLIFLLILSAVLFALQSLPGHAIPTAVAADHLIWIDLQAMSLTLYQNGEEVGRWPVAGGTGNTPTPVGVFRVNRKFRPAEAAWFGKHFLGLNVPWGNYGIHGTNMPGSIGSRASHGCVRMFNKDVERLYKLAPLWTTVVIEDGPYQGLGWSLATLRLEDRGSQVRTAQERLRAKGYYDGALDGIFGRGMLASVRRFRVDHGLPVADVIDQAVWEALGVVLFE